MMKEFSIAEVERCNLAILVLGSIIVTIATRDMMAFVSFAVASAIVTFNFRLLKNVIERLLIKRTLSKTDLFITLPVKFILLFGILTAVIVYGNVQPIYFLIGVSTVFISILVIQFKLMLGSGEQRRENNGA